MNLAKIRTYQKAITLQEQMIIDLRQRELLQEQVEGTLAKARDRLAELYRQLLAEPHRRDPTDAASVAANRKLTLSELEQAERARKKRVKKARKVRARQESAAGRRGR